MKLLLDIKDDKAAFFLELLKNFTFVNEATSLSPEEAEVITDLAEAVFEMNEITEGRIEARDAEDLFDEL